MLKSKLGIIKRRLLNVLLWSVVSAAFIGPGTVTTATKAGASFGFDLLWALLFSTIACLLLQEAAARITITSGLNLGQAIAKQFEGKSTKTIVLVLIIGAIILGCAAYETGNIIGASLGLKLVFSKKMLISWFGDGLITEHFEKFIIVLMGILAALALSLRSLQSIAKIMGVVVMLMGMAFFTTAIYLQPDIGEITKGLFTPSFPEGIYPNRIEGSAGLLILGLIGTTVVPYDLFLGSGVLEKKQSITDMRFGLSVAVILGGIISMAVLSVGTIITKDLVNEAFEIGRITKREFDFPILAYALEQHVGSVAIYIFGFGMFAAGFSSAITAPLASAITARSLFEKENPSKWKPQSRYFKFVWIGILAVGILLGLAGIKPIPAIILAQALNGLILPFISIFLLFVINDHKVMGKNVNGWGSNIALGLVVWVTLVLGLIKVTKQLNDAWEFAIQKGITSFVVISIIALAASVWMMLKIYIERENKTPKD